MTTAKELPPPTGKGPILLLGLIFFAVSTWASYARWANFEYRTFDLAYYTQALWQFIHGRFDVSVEGVPLLGNHVEPIVLLITPLFLIWQHPFTLVIVQNAALASMGPVAFDIGQRLGLNRTAALLLGAAILFTPATGYVALHEFHPEALAAPFLLLMLHARVRSALGAYWGWLIALLACKENMSLVIASYCAVHVFLDRKRPWVELRIWYLWPMALSVVWFLVCTNVITPTLNAGNIDYLALYDRLGTSWGNILLNALTQPQRIVNALLHSLSHGNLFWALLLPFLALPLLRPRWLLIATPILLQHLLSWRSSEWTIYFHYAAPFLPIFWIGLAEGIVRIERWSTIPVSIRNSLPFLVITACIVTQIVLGPAKGIAGTVANWVDGEETRLRKQAFVKQIPPDASVLAPLPYLSHLAMRENLYSLHYVLKGLKTLSRASYSPPAPTDFVLIDYNDSATFDAAAGYYHPAMKTVDDRIIPSSDQLLHEFLRQRSWTARTSDAMTLLKQTQPAELESASSLSSSAGIIELPAGNTLTSITKTSDHFTERGLEIETSWTFQERREIFPWMFLKLIPGDHKKERIISRGLSGPEATGGPYRERWHINLPEQISPGDYDVEVYFIDNSRHAWSVTEDQIDANAPFLSSPISLGKVKVVTGEKLQSLK